MEYTYIKFNLYKYQKCHKEEIIKKMTKIAVIDTLDYKLDIIDIHCKMFYRNKLIDIFCQLNCC